MVTHKKEDLLCGPLFSSKDENPSTLRLRERLLSGAMNSN